ncbi:MAG: hypothetical protein IJ853_00250 [Rickettsiales bacterium]|nr:hypothetical protein [Rickettsiales bacterium]
MPQNNLIEFQNRFRSLQNISRAILKPILKNPKFNFFYTIANNMFNVVDKKYLEYCCVDKVSLDKECKQGNVYFVSYNSATSFYLNNNKQYIIEKINTLFGYGAVMNLFVKEVPTIVKRKAVKKVENNDVVLCVDIKDSKLKQALLNLGRTI